MTKEECKKNIDLIEAHTNMLVQYTSNIAKSDKTIPYYIFFKKDTDGGILIVTLNNIKVNVYIHLPFEEKKEGVTISFSDSWSKARIDIFVPLDKIFMDIFIPETRRYLRNMITRVILTNNYFVSRLQNGLFFDLDFAAKEWSYSIELSLRHCFSTEVK